MWGQRCQEECLETTPPPHPRAERPDAAHDGSEPRFPGPGTLDRALALVRFLRAECAWDREQTAESLIPHLLEETHEVVDAIHEGDSVALEGELGDLLLNLAFQIVVAEESSALDAASVYGRLEAKMIARHPHLFGDGTRRSWEELKAAERGADEGVLSGLARGLDPLTKAYRIQERVAAVGFDWDDYEGALAKVSEELGEATDVLASGPAARVVEELGDLLFAVVNLARLAGAHPTTALARANQKFQDRFERLERLARERGIDMAASDLATLDLLWDEVKLG
ncbi:MAG: nucleoside triphosphate pyrophosphohydrolase [Gemmatimonadota bacterium]